MVTPVITVLMSFFMLFVQYSGVSVSEYDIQRRADIDLLSTGLEAFYAENGGYPMAISPLTLEFAPHQTFEDPKLRAVHNWSPTSDAQEAREIAENHKGPGDYIYVAYGRDGCRNDCLGYFLKTKVDTVENETSYIRAGLKNQ